MGPLNGMRVLDLSQQLPGPYATLLLASLGARVVKVEPPSGDASRRLDPAMFENVNAGKRFVTLDLKTAAGRDELLALVADADVFVEGFRPGVVTRLGCDYSTLREVRPQLVYCSISGLGQEGPLAQHPVHDISVQAMAGTVSGDVDTIGVPWADLATGTSAALAITAAWHAGTGCHLDLAMLDAALAWARVKPSAVLGAREPAYGTVRTSDGELLVIALLEDAMWHRLRIALGWEDDPRLARHADRRRHGAEVRDRLDAEIARRTSTEVLALAAEHDLPIGPARPRDPDTLRQIAARPPGCVPFRVPPVSPRSGESPCISPNACPPSTNRPHPPDTSGERNHE